MTPSPFNDPNVLAILAEDHDALAQHHKEAVRNWFVDQYALHFGERPTPTKFEKVMVALGSIVLFRNIERDVIEAAAKIDELAGLYATAVELELTTD